MKVSIVIPFFNEEENLPVIYHELKNVLGKLKVKYEIIFVNDGSTDGSLNKISVFSKKDKTIKVATYKKRRGKSYALSKGFLQASGDYIFQMDADLQDNPKYLPEFIKELDFGNEMVIGKRIGRKDGLMRSAGSTIFNLLLNVISNTKLADHNSGFKGYKKDVIKKVKLARGDHRFLAVILSRKGVKISEVEVINRKRLYGKSKYGSERIIEAIHSYFEMAKR